MTDSEDSENSEGGNSTICRGILIIIVLYHLLCTLKLFL